MIDFLLLSLVKGLLGLRYRVRVRGLKQILGKGNTGILFLPNHPALIDPIILLSQLYGPFKARALADRDQTDRFLIRRLARRIDVLPIPDVAKSGSVASAEVRQVVDECVEALRGGDNLVVYPSGRTYRQAGEDLGGNSAVETILRRLPSVRVVLVRTRGLWGSRFSWAWGREPDVADAMRHGVRSLLASGIVLAPRRDVTVELAEPDDLPRLAGRDEINRYLERFYNDRAPPNTYVPYTPWEGGSARPLPEPPVRGVRGDSRAVSRVTRQIVCEYLEGLSGTAAFDDDTQLARDLGMDSLARADLLLWLQGEFGFSPSDVDSLRTVGDVMLVADGESVSTPGKALKDVPGNWFARLPAPGRPDHLSAMTVCQAFLAQARRSPDSVIVADQISGAKTYRNLVVAIAAIRGRIGKLPGDRIGIMLPASVAGVVAYLATLFAGKTPVMINWTLGRKSLLHGADSAGVRRILTAEALVSRLQSQGVDLGCVSDRFVYLGQIAGHISRRRKLLAWLTGQFTWRGLRNARPPTTAVVLFTSGSEDLPKAVPLTHRNMLANVSDAYDCFTVQRSDSILGILPPFHSFGLTTSILLPLSLGIRAVYSPNPTDGATLGQMIAAYGASILIGTPTFLDGVVGASARRQLASLRLVISGAEKCTPRVYEALRRRCPQAVVLEGYGVTECSPIISVNHEGDPHPGTIGKVMSSLQYVIVDTQTNQRASVGTPGVLLVRGPSVFAGYLGADVPQPFIRFEGKLWYRTGDLVRQDREGIVTFSGRLKRFIKLGGEMISLPAIEAALLPRYTGDPGEGPVLAVTTAGGEERPEIVLFTTKDLDRPEANQTIRAAGLSGLHSIRRVIRVEGLPVLGTGKTDYRALAERLPNMPGP